MNKLTFFKAETENEIRKILKTNELMTITAIIIKQYS